MAAKATPKGIIAFQTAVDADLRPFRVTPECRWCKRSVLWQDLPKRGKRPMNYTIDSDQVFTIGIHSCQEYRDHRAAQDAE